VAEARGKLGLALSLSVDAGAKRIALVAPTAADARDVMVFGESGLLAIPPPWNRPTPILSRRRLE
jgi:phage terminase large subunit-like protein